MKYRLTSAVTLIASVLIAYQPAVAAEVKLSGTACWTGSTSVVATSAKDVGWTWSLTGTYVDDNNKALNSYYHCIGFGGLTAGKPQQTEFWCKNHYADKATALSRGVGNPDRTSTSKFVSGTGSHEGVTGEITGGARTSIGKPPQGKFAACRQVTGTKVLK